MNFTKTTVLGLIILIFSLSGYSANTSNSNNKQEENSKWAPLLSKLYNSHDLVTLPMWGPYTKKYMGTSHVDSMKKGMRFDLSIFPAFYRRKVNVPNVNFETDYYPWAATPDLTYFKIRQMLEWKDKVYGDISYYLLDNNSQAIEIDLQNKTEFPQTLSTHFMASMNFPAIAHEFEPNCLLYPDKVSLKNNAVWINSIDYSKLSYAVQKPTDNLVKDGQIKGEQKVQEFVNGSGVELGINKNDKIIFDLNIKNDFYNSALVFRYKMDKGTQLLLITIDGKTLKTVKLKADSDITTIKIPAGNLKTGNHKISFTTKNCNSLLMDGFAVCNNNSQDVFFSKINWDYVPEKIYKPTKESIILKYKYSDNYYGIKWFFPDYKIREFFCRNLDIIFPIKANNHTKSKFYGEGKGHYLNIYLRPINIKPESSRQIYAEVFCTDSLEKAKEKINKTSAVKLKNNISKLKNNISKLNKKINNIYKINYNSSGNKYLFSQNIMKSILMTNVVFPVYTQKHYIRHACPGKYWDSLYTWDSGFIGLGLLQYSIKRAVENLNAYTTPPGSQSAFIHHGTPLPVQQYLFYEIWNKTQSKELLKYFYPRLKQYYEFLAGKLGSSTTAKFKSGLISTWDYFYNSGGWDDYPPQKYIDQHNLNNIAPVIATSQCIRCAKFLIMYADILGLNKDKASYEQDIQKFTEALNKYSWDKSTGCYSYVVHDKNGYPTGFFKTKDGINFNEGLDGIYPLAAGICDNKRANILIKHLESPKELWTPYGITAVSQSAPYYRKDGYWNGTVWMPHQWFIWKTMLDYGKYKFADKIAMTALNLWKREVDNTYRSFEHFIIDSGRGAGWHAFGGLSSPVVVWFSAYFRPGTINTGFDTIVLNKKFNNNNSNLMLKVKLYGDRPSAILICMNSNYKYKLAGNSNEISLVNTKPGCLVIKINKFNPGKELNIQIVKKNK